MTDTQTTTQDDASPPPRDLHALTEHHGTRAVAARIGVTYRNLLDLRHGTRPLTVDHLYELCRHYPEFDLAATVDGIGHKRAEKGLAFRVRRGLVDDQAA